MERARLDGPEGTVNLLIQGIHSQAGPGKGVWGVCVKI